MRGLNYDDYKPVLTYAASRLAGAKGWDRQEALAECDYLYALAAKTWDRTACSFGYWLRYLLNRRLKDRTRRETRRAARVGGRLGVDLDSLPAHPKFDFRSFYRQLPDDAKDAVCVCLLLDAANPRRPTRLAVRQALRSLGWNRLRVRRAFEQVRENL